MRTQARSERIRRPRGATFHEQIRRPRGAARWVVAGLLRWLPARALAWLPVSVVRGLLVVALGRLPWLVGSVLLLAAGCGVARDDAEALLARGQPVAALRELEAEQAGNAHRDPPARARYALLRGLVHLSLADHVAAEWWLLQAGDMVVAEPSCLDAANRARLEDALQGLARGP